jgi:hypothetical protein
MPLPQSSDSVESQYLKIKEVQPSRPGALTKIFGVYSKSQEAILGYISWAANWRQYVLKPDSGTYWSPDCLEFISEFIKKLMAERKQ